MVSASPLPTFIPTPNPNNSDWVQRRLDAVIQLYGLSEEGESLLRSLDLRQMRGEPGFFGSYGFAKWAGVGEAKPIGVIHEIGHSYWGGFPIEGFPELGWDTPPGSNLSPAMEKYHDDIRAFMAQPPDGYELLRQRLRNLPDLSIDNQEPLTHNVEADLVYNTGGGLNLIPPILRKYWDRFLNPGPFTTWYEAATWFMALSGDERTTAGKYLGFEHMDLRHYDSLHLSGNGSQGRGINLLAAQVMTLTEEEEQRLFDLADQFDLLLGEAQEVEKFQFWRGYLKDKVTLQRDHPGYLPSTGLANSLSLDSALGFLNTISDLPPQEQARLTGERLAEEPITVNFLPALDNRALLALFRSGVELPQGTTLQATASFVQRLERFNGLVDEVLAEGRTSPQRGAQKLKDFLSDLDFEEQREDLRLFLELLREQDQPNASLIIQALDKSTVRALMVPVPTQLRFTLAPEELLAKLDIITGASISDLKRGVTLLVEEPSGNFVIDEPYLDTMYGVIDSRSPTETPMMLEVILETPFPLEGFIQKHPQATQVLLGSNLEAAVVLVQGSDPMVSPPARIVYRLINSNPVLAAQVVTELEAQGESETLVESLAYLAYDKARSETVPGLPISLERDGRFLAALLGQLGESALGRRLNQAFTLYGVRASRGEVPADFLAQFQATLHAAAASIPDAEVWEALEAIIPAT